MKRVYPYADRSHEALAEMVADGMNGVHLFYRLFVYHETEGDQTARSTQASPPSSVLLQPGSWQIPITTDTNVHATRFRSANTLCYCLPSLPPSMKHATRTYVSDVLLGPLDPERDGLFVQLQGRTKVSSCNAKGHSRDRVTSAFGRILQRSWILG
jgi:hypothetical protein